MLRSIGLAAGCAALLLLLCGAASLARTPGTRGPVLHADPRYDLRTEIAPSAIPGAGNGLFARTKIREGEIIGELGGELIDEPDLDNPSAYLAGLAECPSIMATPYRYLDSKVHGGHASRINFAPRTINGVATNLQNARIDRLCHGPYVLFVATRDIEPGEEVWASYGPHYNYERFMYVPAVRDFFCGLVHMDCRETFEFEP